jgi:hypothetical protein
MPISGRFLRGSLGLPFKVVLALYMFAAALMPLGHHDLACHIKSATHCTTCTVGASAEAGADAGVLARFWFLDAGAAISAPVETARLSTRRPPSGRAPPSFA